jgi:methyltransferase (TIGR00027 family)
VTTHRQWDIVTGVGITALVVAAARAIETAGDEPLIDDPFAAHFVRAAAPPNPLPVTAEEAGSFWLNFSTYMAVRTRFFDDFFARASAAGVRQAVILASGLDARAFRLAWPTGTSVFEIDQPKVLEFKDEVVAAQGAVARCDRHAVAIDLREDWASALSEAGFDERLPTAWLAEGLLPYLPAEAEQQLLDTIDKFSVPGSHLALETIRGMGQMMDDPQYAKIAEQWGIDMNDLVHDDDRPEPVEPLRARGWTVTVDPASAIADAYGRVIGPMAGSAEFVTAVR